MKLGRLVIMRKDFLLDISDWLFFCTRYVKVAITVHCLTCMERLIEHAKSVILGFLGLRGYRPDDAQDSVPA